jgi:hypothetical protein
LSGELLYTDEARELSTAALAPVTERLRTMPKAMAPRLVGQTQRQIETAISTKCNRILEAGRRAVERFKEKTSREL